MIGQLASGQSSQTFLKRNKTIKMAAALTMPISTLVDDTAGTAYERTVLVALMECITQIFGLPKVIPQLLAMTNKK